MEQDKIATLCKQAAAGSEEALLQLLECFTPLLKKYACKFEYEDTFAELQLYLIQLIKNFPLTADDWNDGQTVNYIAKAIYTYYIKLSKHNSFRENYLLEFNPEIMDRTARSTGTEQRLMLQEAFAQLSSWQKTVLTMHYLQGYSIQEIAKIYGKSRQAVNKVKVQALDILQKQLNR